MEKKTRETCDQLLSSVSEENEQLVKKQKAYEEEKAALDAAHEKYRVEVEHFSSAQQQFNAYTQEAMRQLEEERRVTTQHKEDLSEGIQREEKELGELKQRTEALKKIRAEREQKVKKLEDQIAASSDAVASLKKNESKLRRAQDKYEEVAEMKKQIARDKEQISEKLLELDRKRVLITDIQQKAEAKEVAAKADKQKIEQTLNEISDKERSIRQLHRRLRQFEDDLKAKEAALMKKAGDFAKKEEVFKRESEIYRVNTQGHEKKLNDLVTKTDSMQVRYQHTLVHPLSPLSPPASFFGERRHLTRREARERLK